MSFTRPLGAARSDRQREREAVLRRTREVVRQRGSAGRCQWPGCKRSGTDLAHGWGRGHIIGQPLCDHPTLCWWACRDHHDVYDGRTWGIMDSEERNLRELQWAMAHNAIKELLGAETAHESCDFPIDAVRWLERRLRETGVIHGREWA